MLTHLRLVGRKQRKALPALKDIGKAHRPAIKADFRHRFEAPYHLRLRTDEVHVGPKASGVDMIQSLFRILLTGRSGQREF